MPPEPGASASGEVLVHILLKENVRKDSAAREEALKVIRAVSPVRDLDEGRLALVGIATGWVIPDRITEIRALSVVEAVLEDRPRKVL